jgi:hypothetical protein
MTTAHLANKVSAKPASIEIFYLAATRVGSVRIFE